METQPRPTARVIDFAVPLMVESSAVFSQRFGRAYRLPPKPASKRPRKLPKPRALMGSPHTLHPIAWGVRDARLARMVCWTIERTMPPTETPWRYPRPARMLTIGQTVTGVLALSLAALYAAAAVAR